MRLVGVRIRNAVAAVSNFSAEAGMSALVALASNNVAPVAGSPIHTPDVPKAGRFKIPESAEVNPIEVGTGAVLPATGIDFRTGGGKSAALAIDSTTGDTTHNSDKASKNVVFPRCVTHHLLNGNHHGFHRED